MQTIESAQEMEVYARAVREQGKTIALVPTMGALHRAHLELLRLARVSADIVVVSVFVNPAQFGPAEDFTDYPRDIKNDKKLARGAGADIFFNPTAGEIYPEGFATSVEVSGEMAKKLCGRRRPGHFKGVSTVVAKLFNIVRPHCAVFGLKDYQQYLIIWRMVTDLAMDIELIPAETIREADGLAVSSRNKYLNAKERKAASAIAAMLEAAGQFYKSGESSSSVILKQARKTLGKEPLINIDYIKICDPTTLDYVKNVEVSVLLAVAVNIGATRLIDNCMLGSGYDSIKINRCETRV